MLVWIALGGGSNQEVILSNEIFMYWILRENQALYQKFKKKTNKYDSICRFLIRKTLRPRISRGRNRGFSSPRKASEASVEVAADILF